MELSNNLEEIISDDYEEGEIFEEDNLYEEVSSLEEFSCNESDTNRIEEADTNESVTISAEKSSTKHHRRKEHKCKEDSVCRKERKGKHCYARIRKEKLPVISKTKVVEEVAQPFNDKNVSRRLEVGSVNKRSNKRSKQASPPRLVSDNVKPYRHDYKDYHEKENRYTNKKHWSNNEKSARDRPKYPDKYDRTKNKRDNSRDYIRSKYTSSSHWSGSDIKSNTENSQVTTKTSLLKRLVGSGATGVKTLKDNENINSCAQSDCSDIITGAEVSSTSSVSSLSDIKENKLPAREGSPDEVRTVCFNDEPTSPSSTEVRIVDDTKVLPNELNAIKAPPQESAKKIEVKWMRSIKEDTDTLHLRVEALRSAWVKKFNERKKKGLIHQKKVEGIDDSLADFVLDSDSDDFDTCPIASIPESVMKTPPPGNESTDSKFKTTDISGDILKPEDMVIVNLDKIPDQPIICESPQIVTSTHDANMVNDTSNFIASSTNLFPVHNEHLLENLSCNSKPNDSLRALSHNSVIQSGRFNSSKPRERNSSRSNKVGNRYIQKGQENTNRSIKNVTPKTFRDRRSLSRSVNRSDRKSISKFKKRARRKIKKESLKNSVNSVEIDDETLLREQALLSLKSKKSVVSSVQSREDDVRLIIVNSTEDQPNVNLLLNRGESNELIESKPIDNRVKVLCESEGTGATSSDNWEDDLDEDILRAKLLSSLTKQVSEHSTKVSRVLNGLISKPNANMEYNAPARVLNTKKVIQKKQDRRKLKNINRKVWKQSSLVTDRKIDEAKIKQYNKGNVYVKNDKTTQSTSLNMQSSSIPSIPQVAKLIISLNDSDDSLSDMEIVDDSPEKLSNETILANNIPPDIEANIDLLLREAERNTQLEKSSNQISLSKPIEESEVNKNQDSKMSKNQDLTSSKNKGTSETPQALKHLPAWQQEEYRRLKKKIAEKEKVLQVTRAKVTEPLKDSLSTAQVLEASTQPLDTNVPQSNSISTTTESAEHDSNCELLEDHTIKENDQIKSNICPSEPEDKISNKNVNCLTNYSDDSGNTEKKNFTSCSMMVEINLMNDIVNEFHKNCTEYTELKQKMDRLTKLMKLTEAKISSKQKKLLQMKDKIKEKDRTISSKISSLTLAPVSSSDQNKTPGRDMELIKLKYKEISLKAQFYFHDFSTENNKWDENVSSNSQSGQPVAVKRSAQTMSDQSSKKKMINEPDKKDAEPLKKRTFSAKEREREEWDPNTPVCLYDLNGICKDEECKYQHFKTV